MNKEGLWIYWLETTVHRRSVPRLQAVMNAPCGALLLTEVEGSNMKK